MNWFKRLTVRVCSDNGGLQVIDEAMARAIARQGEVREWMAARGFQLVLDPFTGRYAAGFNPNQEYQFMREGWEQPHTMRLANTHPAFNVAGLYYRPLLA